MSYDASTGKVTFNGIHLDPLQLEEVIVFKFLGIHLNCSPYSFFRSFNENVKKKARSYLSSVLSLTRSGPSRSALAHTLWTVCGIPSILYGAEIIPLTQDTIDVVEKCNTAVGKFILQIPRSSSDVCCYIDAGLKPISAILSEKVLLYAYTIMKKPATYWARLAMDENLAFGSRSSYARYLLKLKTSSNCLQMTPEQIKKSVQNSAISNIFKQLHATSTNSFPLMHDRCSYSKLP